MLFMLVYELLGNSSMRFDVSHFMSPFFLAFLLLPPSVFNNQFPGENLLKDFPRRKARILLSSEDSPTNL
jgi:hypothetical protein